MIVHGIGILVVHIGEHEILAYNMYPPHIPVTLPFAH